MRKILPRKAFGIRAGKRYCHWDRQNCACNDLGECVIYGTRLVLDGIGRRRCFQCLCDERVD